MEGLGPAGRSGCTIVALALLLAACGGDDDTDRPAGPTQVVITEQGFEPANVRVEVGDRVTFVNRAKLTAHSAKDESGGEIDVSPQPGTTKHDGSEVNRATKKGFATHSLFPGERQTVIFGVPRTYRYYSAFDPSMRGTIEVSPRQGP